MRVYYDNVVASGLATGRLWPESERDALATVEEYHRRGTIKRVTSRESWREQARTRNDEKRQLLRNAQHLVSVVQADHRVVGFASLDGPRGTVSTLPLVDDVVDVPLFKDLTALGLKAADAKHFMYASANACVRFVTLDSDFFDRKAALESRVPSLRVVRPSELASELRAIEGAG